MLCVLSGEKGLSEGDVVDYLAGTLTVCWLLAAPRFSLLEALDGISYIVLRLPKCFHMYLLKLRFLVKKYIYTRKLLGN